MIELNNHNENDYKVKLIEYILSTHPRYKFVSEYPFYFMRRRADFMILEPDNRYTHAFEIKSDIDNIYSLEEQLIDYQKSFNKTSILISNKHIQVLKNVPKSIGVLIYKDGEIIHKREATPKIRLNKIAALDLLSTKMLLSLYAGKKTNSSRIEMIENISKNITYRDIQRYAYNSVSEKVSPIYSLFKKEQGENISFHDISLLALRTSTLKTD